MKSGLAKWLSLLFLVPILSLVFALGCGEYKGSDCAKEIAENGFCIFTTGQEGYEAEITASDCTNIAGSATVDPGDPVDADFKFVFWAADTLPENLPYVVVDQCRLRLESPYGPTVLFDGTVTCGPWKVEPKVGSDATQVMPTQIYPAPPDLQTLVNLGYYMAYLTIGARPAFSTNYVYETSYSWVNVKCKSEGGGP